MNQPDFLGAQKELLISSYNQATAYTNVVLVAGYAGFLAIWTHLANDVTALTKFSSGLLIALSIGGFIAWETYSMIFRSKLLLGMSQAVNQPDRFKQLMEEHRALTQNRMIEFGRLWNYFSLPFIAGTGFSALLIMVSAFIHLLWLNLLLA